MVGALGLWVSAQEAPVRAHWVQAASLRSPEAVRRMAATAAGNGFNALFVPVSADDAGATGLTEAIDAARRHGLRVHAWVTVNLVSDGTELPSSRDHVVYQHPEWLMVPRELAPELLAVDVRSPEYLGRLARWTRANPSRVDGMYVSPLHAGVQGQLAARIKDLVSRHDVDGVHLDALRYPSADFDYSGAAVDAFRREMRGRLPAAETLRLDAIEAIDPFAYPEELPEDWRLFRQSQLTALVARLRSTAKAVRPAIMISAAVVPGSAAEAREAFQDWRTWLDYGFVDALCPVGSSDAQFAALVADVRALAGSTPVWLRD
jgi:uncharacterized lipoprotein YddW (UPF0748 family)